MCLFEIIVEMLPKYYSEVLFFEIFMGVAIVLQDGNCCSLYIEDRLRAFEVTGWDVHV